MDDLSLPPAPTEEIPQAEPQQAQMAESPAIVPPQEMVEQAKLVNVVDPDTLQVGSIPEAQLQDAISQGYQPASDDQVHKFINQQKYGSAGQQALTALEGAGEGVAGPLFTAAQKALGVKGEDILGRREENPLAHGAGQVTGLVGSLATGVGAAALAEQAGAAGAKALGLGAQVAKEAGLASKIGSMATKAAIENMVIQSSDEATKMLAQDPGQSLETAVTDIGLAGLIGGGAGGAFGAVNPLWEATVGGKVSSVLKALTDRAGGVDGVAPDIIEDMITKTGMNIAPEVKAAMKGNPYLEQAFQTLQESTTTPGMEAQAALKNFKEEANKSLLNVFGKNVEDIDALSQLSEYEAGKTLKETMAKDIKGAIDPLSERYEQMKNRFSKEPIMPSTTDITAQRIAEMAAEKGYNVTSLGGEQSMVSQVLSELPKIKNLEELTKYQSALNRSVQGKPELWDAARNIRNILRDTESELISQRIAEKSPELLDTFGKARMAYADNMKFIDELNDRLHVGRYSGPGSFLRNLSEMKPEDVIRRMGGKRDADLLNKFMLPEWEKQVKDFHLSQALKGAADSAGPGEIINSKKFLKALDKMSPELRNFVVGSENQAQLKAIEGLLNAIPSKMNPSGTAKTLDALWSNVPGTAAGMATMVFSHNPALSFLVGGLTKYIGRDIPDAARLGLLKFLGSNQKIEAGGFKAMVDFIHSTIKGESLVSKATKNIFTAGREVLPKAFIPSEKEREKLNKQLKAYQVDPRPMIDIGGKIPHYLPEQGAQMGQLAATATNYLNSLRPQIQKRNPLDSDVKPSKAEEAVFNRALDIAQQPLMVLEHLKSGTILPQDIQTFKTIYPKLYDRVAQKLNNEIVNVSSQDESIPYKTRLGLSLFLGHPIDSTMAPESIMANQITFELPGMRPESNQQNQQKAPPESSMKGLSKLPKFDMTATQAREANRLK